MVFISAVISKKSTTGAQGHGESTGGRGFIQFVIPSVLGYTLQMFGERFERFIPERYCFLIYVAGRLNIISNPPCAPVPLWLHFLLRSPQEMSGYLRKRHEKKWTVRAMCATNAQS